MAAQCFYEFRYGLLSLETTDAITHNTYDDRWS
jgi:hypothetical protein